MGNVGLIWMMVILLFVGCSEDNSTSPSENVSIAFSNSFTGEDWSDPTKLRQYLYVLVTDGEGNPLSNKRVDWEILEGDGELVESSNLTNSSDLYLGQAINWYYWNNNNSAKIKASVYGYDANIEFTIVRKL